MTNTRTSTWENIGTKVSGKSIEDVLAQAKLNYTVSVKPLMFNEADDNEDAKYQRLENFRATVRDDDQHFYGIVSPGYVPIQNQQAFDFINYIDEDVEFVKAGETRNGLVYVIGKLPEMKVLGDDYQNYVIFQNSHNGCYSLQTTICPLRVVCKNQFNLMFKESNNTVKIRHTKNAEQKLSAAREVLAGTNQYIKTFSEYAEKLAQQKITTNKLEMFLNYMFPVKENMTDSAKLRLEEEKQKFLKAYNADDNANFKWTIWGLLNGLTDYITHYTPSRKVENVEEKRFITTIVDNRKLNQAFDYALSLNA